MEKKARRPGKKARRAEQVNAERRAKSSDAQVICPDCGEKSSTCRAGELGALGKKLG
jgi:hypothetical protein